MSFGCRVLARAAHGPSGVARFGALVLLSGTALAPLVGHADPAPADCKSTVTGSATLVLCDSSHVAASTGPGDASLTLTNQVTGSAWISPGTSADTPTSHVLVVTGNSVITNTDNNGGVFSSTDAPDHDIVARFDEAVTINSSAGFGAIWLRNDISGDITVTSAATVFSSSGAAITAVTNGGNVSVTNTGTVTATSDATLNDVGLYAENGSAVLPDSIVTIVNSGTVSAWRAATRAINYNGIASVTNTGTLISSNRQAIVAWADIGDAWVKNDGIANGGASQQGIASWGGRNATVINNGTVTAVGNDTSYGIDVRSQTEGNAMLTNNGTVQSTNFAALYAYSEKGNVVIVNAGTASGMEGISADAHGGGTITITNIGSISGITNGVVLSGSDDTLTNYGSISGGDYAVLMGDGNDIFIYEAGSTVSGAVDGGAGADTLLLGERDGTFDIGQIGADATYRNFETLSLTVGTHWTLTGSSELVGTIALSGATLTLGQSSPSDFGVVMTSALLNGNGTIGGLTAGSGATVSPGNSIGRIDVAGDVTFLPGSTYVAETDGASGNADLIAATGSATISGGSLVVAMTAPATNWQNVYTILTADGGVSGAFDSVATDGSLTFLDPMVSYQANAVTVAMARNATAFATYADTPNERATADALDALAPSSAVYGLIVTQDAAGAAMAFDQLSGEVYATAKTALIDDSRFVRAATARQMWLTEGSDEPSAWMQGYGSWGGFDGDGNAAGYDRDTGGFFVGADGAFSGFRLGLVGGYGQSTVKLDDGRGSVTADTVSFGVYGGGEWDNVLVNFGLNNAWSQLSSERYVAFPGYSDALSADYDANTFQVYGDVGYSFDFEAGSIQPFAGLAYVNLDTDGFTETGGAGALHVEGNSIDTTYTTVGVRGKADFKVKETTLSANGLIGWRHSLNDETPTSANAFAGGGLFTVSGVPLAQDVGVFELGLEAALTPMASIGVSYAGQFGSGVSDQGVQANFKLKF